MVLVKLVGSMWDHSYYKGRIVLFHGGEICFKSNFNNHFVHVHKSDEFLVRKFFDKRGCHISYSNLVDLLNDSGY